MGSHLPAVKRGNSLGSTPFLTVLPPTDDQLEDAAEAMDRLSAALEERVTANSEHAAAGEEETQAASFEVPRDITTGPTETIRVDGATASGTTTVGRHTADPVPPAAWRRDKW